MAGNGRIRARRFSLPQAYRFAPAALRRQPRIIVPFSIFVFAELLCLSLLYLAPRPPLSAILAPPIRAFWGDMYLHYPNNFLLLPQLASWSRTVLYVVIGSFLNGMAVLMVGRVYAGVREHEGVAASTLRRYGALFGVSLLLTALYVGLVKLSNGYLSSYFLVHERLLLLPPGIWMGPVVFVFDLLLGIITQSLFVYAAPGIMLEDRSFFSSITRSFALFAQWPLVSIMLVAVPVALYVPLMVLQYKTPFFVQNNPESVLLIAAAGSLVNSLIVDLLVTVSVTYFYLKVND
ncbi:MAG: hypothetical protein ACM3OC_01085 [Deltaproteobacteria bacterium]